MALKVIKGKPRRSPRFSCSVSEMTKGEKLQLARQNKIRFQELWVGEKENRKIYANDLGRDKPGMKPRVEPILA